MSWQAPNLARAPFVNARPRHRLAALLALAALTLTAWNVRSWLQSGAGAAAREAEIAHLETETAALRARLTTLDADLAGRDFAAENRRVEFLNARIEQRAFSWNLLLDRLAEALPPGVRLRELEPRFAAPAGDERTPVTLRIRAEARDDEEMLTFVDRLFAHPAFAAPNLARESRQTGGTLAFELAVIYDSREER
jgi:Tfp pilus assembly protein PilN